MTSIANTISKRPHTQYRGRFAPSPSGLLHFGSLVAALASFLQARSNNGKWLIRIEDIDKPREMPGADSEILKTLDAYGMHWDESVLYQSQQSDLYWQVLEQLHQQGLSYYCQCTRAMIKKAGGIYTGHCKNLAHPLDNSAIRLVNEHHCNEFVDGIQGAVHVDPALSAEDFIIHRRDGLFAYQLAVVVDDIYQGITEVVRGCDLLEPTARQLTLFKTLGAEAPKYMHVPLAITDQGYKLSKQNSAPAIDNANPQPALIKALKFLGQQPPQYIENESIEKIIDWAISHWRIDLVPKKQEIML